jgi:hypothetical protein
MALDCRALEALEQVKKASRAHNLMRRDVGIREENEYEIVCLMVYELSEKGKRRGLYMPLPIWIDGVIRRIGAEGAE